MFSVSLIHLFGHPIDSYSDGNIFDRWIAKMMWSNHRKRIQLGYCYLIFTWIVTSIFIFTLHTHTHIHMYTCTGTAILYEYACVLKIARILQFGIWIVVHSFYKCCIHEFMYAVCFIAMKSMLLTHLIWYDMICHATYYCRAHIYIFTHTNSFHILF